jgi:hypothetical protein
VSLGFDPTLLDWAAGLVVIAVAARAAAARSRVALAPLAGDALLCVALATLLLLASGTRLELGVPFTGAAALAGIYWAGLADHPPRLGGRGLALSAAGAVLVAAVVMLLAWGYQWWFAPVALLAVAAAGLLANLLLPRLEPAPVEAVGPRTPPPAPGRPLPSPAPAPPAAPGAPAAVAAPALAAKVPIACPSCGFRGRVGPAGPPTLKCPRCGAAVPRPTAPPRPGAAPAGSRPAPRQRGPSS